MDLPVGPPAPTTRHGGRPVSPSTVDKAPLSLEPGHALSLYKRLGSEENAHRWTYMFSHGFSSLEECEASIRVSSEAKDPHFFVAMTGPASDSAAEPAALFSYLNSIVALCLHVRKDKVAAEVDRLEVDAALDSPDSFAHRSGATGPRVTDITIKQSYPFSSR